MCGRGSLSGFGITPQGVREAAGSLRAACVAGMSARQATARSVRQVGVCDMRTGACFFFTCAPCNTPGLGEGVHLYGCIQAKVARCVTIAVAEIQP